MPTSSTTTTIGVAVVEQNGGYLIGVRSPDQPLPGLAEFPGGKCRPGESPRDCAVRECLEETGLMVEAIESLSNREFRYGHDQVDLHFWLCRPVETELMASNHHGFRWVPADELASLDFPAANAPIVAMLTSK